MKTNAILVFILLIIIITLSIFGKFRRTVVSPAVISRAESIDDINLIWRAYKIKGRILVIFGRHINPWHQGRYFYEFSYSKLNIHDGTIREIYQIVPNKIFPELYNEWQEVKIGINKTEDDFFVAAREGRVHFTPLSNLPSFSEDVITIIDAMSWDQDELLKIQRMLSSGVVKSDILTIMRASKENYKLFEKL